MKVSGPVGPTGSVTPPPVAAAPLSAGPDVRTGNDNGMVPGESPVTGSEVALHETPLSPERRCLSVGGPGRPPLQPDRAQDGTIGANRASSRAPLSPPTDEYPSRGGAADELTGGAGKQAQTTGTGRPVAPPRGDECRHCHVSVIDMVDANGDPYLLVAHNPFCPMVSPDRSGGGGETVEETAGESVWDEPWLSAPRWREERETT